MFNLLERIIGPLFNDAVAETLRSEGIYLERPTMLTEDQLRRLKSIVSDAAIIEPAELNDGTDLRMHLDSLNALDCLLDIEEAFDVTFSRNTEFHTFGELRRIVEGLVG
jgi:acyl carrier protein